MLTKKQHAILGIIEKYQEQYKNFPDMAELAAAFKKKRNGLYPVINQLVDEEYLERLGYGSYVIKNVNWKNEQIEPNQEDVEIEAAVKYYKEKHGI